LESVLTSTHNFNVDVSDDELMNQLHHGYVEYFLETSCPLRNYSENENLSSNNLGYACSNCFKFLSQFMLPPLSLGHEELVFPDVAPEIKGLNRIEERILAPRIAFIEIRSNYVDLQLKSKGRIVNVPTDVQSNLNLLPRNYENLGVVMVKLKRRKSYKRNECVSTIRIEAIKAAAKILANSETFPYLLKYKTHYLFTFSESKSDCILFKYFLSK